MNVHISILRKLEKGFKDNSVVVESGEESDDDTAKGSHDTSLALRKVLDGDGTLGNEDCES